ncbi:MAG: hypothetical protein K6T27_09370, partial [Thermoleophilum sp.]|nr:hypothetical protein [Thermoleophilum sp.]
MRAERLAKALVPSMIGAGLLAEPEEAEARPRAIWRMIAQALKGTVVEEHAPITGTKWGVIEVPTAEGRKFLRIKPDLGVHEVERVGDRWIARKQILGHQEAIEMISPRTPTEEDIQQVVKKFKRQTRTEDNIYTPEELYQILKRLTGYKWALPLSHGVEVSEPGREQLIRTATERLINQGFLIREGDHYITQRVTKMLPRFSPAQMEKAIEESLLNWPTGARSDSVAVDLSRELGEAPRDIKPLAEYYLHKMAQQGKIIRDPAWRTYKLPDYEQRIAERLAREPFTQEEIQEGIRRVREEGIKGALTLHRIYGTVPPRELGVPIHMAGAVLPGAPEWRREAFQEAVRKAMLREGLIQHT